MRSAFGLQMMAAELKGLPYWGGQQPLRFPTTVQMLSKHALLMKGHAPTLFEQPTIVLHDFAEKVRVDEPMLFSGLASAGDEQFRTSILETHAHARWVSFGLPAFEITRDLLAGFVLTDPANVNVADVHLPFPTFAITLPKGFWSIVSKDESGAVEGVTLIVHFYDALINDEIRRSILIQMVCTDGTCLWDRVTWPRSETFEHWLSNADVKYVILGKLEEDEKQLQMILRRVVVNLALFVAEHGRGKRKEQGEARKTRKRKPKRAAKLNKPKVEIWILGHTIKLGAELIEAARASVGATDQYWRLSKRFCVRGHQRHQPHGPGRKLRKWIWIKPHWKGPKDGERLAHLYTDGKHDEADRNSTTK